MKKSRPIDRTKKSNIKCEHCGNEAEYMYLVDGDWVCEDCLKEMAERVDMEVER